MTQIPLRSWVRKYGTMGILLASLYLGVHYLWTKRRSVLMAGCFAATLLIICIWYQLTFTRHIRVSGSRTRRLIAQAKPLTRQREVSIPACGRLAYVLSGNLYLQSLPDGPSQQLTTDGHNERPMWSSSGGWLAFVRDLHLWVIRRSGQQARCLSEAAQDFAWSPVSDILVYYQAGSLCLIEPGSWHRRIVEPAPPFPSRRLAKAEEGTESDRDEDAQNPVVNSEAAWSADGKWLAYAQHDSRENLSSLWYVRAAGGRSRQIYRARGDGFVSPMMLRWFPDSQRLLFWAAAYIGCSINADGSPLLEVSRSGGRPKPLIEVPGVPKLKQGDDVLQREDFVAFSPDGKRLAVTQGGSRFEVENKSIRTMDVTTGQARQLTSPEKACTCPTWSPDSRYIAYIAAPDDARLEWDARNKQCHLWCMDADGTHRRALLQDPTYADDTPHWLADGKHLLLTRYDCNDNASLWTVETDGHGAHKIMDVDGKDVWHSEYMSIWTPRNITAHKPNG